MTLDGLGEMFRGYSEETCAGKFPLVPMGVRAEGPVCADTGPRTPIGASGNFAPLLKSQFGLDQHSFEYLSFFRQTLDYLIQFCR